MTSPATARLRAAAITLVRAVLVTLAVVAVTAVATGWLYWLRGVVANWPGPRVPDALALDELPGHDSVPLVVYVLVFALVGLVLGLVARAARLDRLAAGLGLALGVGAWLVVADAASLFLVRQNSMGSSFRAAAGLQPVYLAAALAGAGGALLGRPASGWNTRRMLTWTVAGGGLIDLVAALLPRHHAALGMLERVGAGVVPAAHVLLVPVGMLLLVGSRGLARGNCRAWKLCAALLWLSVALHLVRGPDYPSVILTALAAVALMAGRSDFPFRGDPAAEPPALQRLAWMLAAAIAYGFVALSLYRAVAGLPFSPFATAWDSVRALAGLAPHGSQYLPAHFSRWYPAAAVSIEATGVAWAALVWVRPWRDRLFPGDAANTERAEEIVRRWGSDTLAPFALRLDKQRFFTGASLVAYRVVRGVAVVSGDPVGPPGEAGAAIGAFLGHARARGWNVAILGASGRLLDVYRQWGLRPVYHGDEAVIDTGDFALEGRPMRTVRQAVHRVERHGYRAEVVMAGDATPALRAELAAAERGWLHGRVRKGFTMELDDPFRLGGDDAVYVVGRDAQGEVAGYLHLAVCHPGRSLSLSSMPRWPGTPNGFSAWLVVVAADWARANGYTSVSLNFSPFAGLLTVGTALTVAERVKRRALLRLKDVLALQLDNLYRFNRQFDPRWEPRYVVIERRADLPRTALVAMAAEGYLPRAWLILIRGPGWAPPSEPPAGEDQSAAREPAGGAR
jgi:lysyl-tRNA synthetase, class II